ncbi:MAG: UvrB/UvrC motif-containing protein [Oscillospiraceae bacterium]|nr:UvrB/UvrC motif-containing protein [Oscillospiraceae bacterium]
MKCDRCGKDANFYYSSTVNGQHSERCLCADCAREAGFENAFEFGDMEAMAGVLSGLIGSILSGEKPGSAGAFGPMAAVRRLSRPLSEAESKIPADAGEEVRARRETEALRQQLADAVAAEDYELAASLRDQLNGGGEEAG